jgi:hypothetical protein
VEHTSCKVRSALLSELAQKSGQVADTAHQLAELAGRDGPTTLEERVGFVNRRSQLRVLNPRMRSSPRSNAYAP